MITKRLPASQPPGSEFTDFYRTLTGAAPLLTSPEVNLLPAAKIQRQPLAGGAFFGQPAQTAEPEKLPLFDQKP